MNEKESESVRQLTEIELKSIYYQDNLPALAVTCLAPASARVGLYRAAARLYGGRGDGQASLASPGPRPSLSRLNHCRPGLHSPRPGHGQTSPASVLPSPPQKSQNLWPPAEPRGYGAGGEPPRHPCPLSGAARRRRGGPRGT